MAKRKARKVAKDAVDKGTPPAAADAAPEVCGVCGKAPGRDQSLVQLELADGRKSGKVCSHCFKVASEAVKGRQPVAKAPAPPGHIPDDLAGEIFAQTGQGEGAADRVRRRDRAPQGVAGFARRGADGT